MSNPIKSMSGNMWAALRKLRRHNGCECHDRPCRTRSALAGRGLALELGDTSKVSPRQYMITDLGRMVCDAFTEGKEGVR